MSRPSATKAALWMAGESECATGRPMMPMSCVVPVTVVPPLESALRRLRRPPYICRRGDGSCGGPGDDHVRGAHCCLLYTSDAADDLLCVDLGGRRIIKKK